jgi:hypothetical protein
MRLPIPEEYTMDLVVVFPKDPFQPTIEYIAINQTPFSVPWGRTTIRLGKGFNSRRGELDGLFTKSSAFKVMENAPLQYRQFQITTIKDESGSSIAYSSGNTSFAISGSAGKGFLSASIRGSYEKNVHDNRNVGYIILKRLMETANSFWTEFKYQHLRRPYMWPD